MEWPKAFMIVGVATAVFGALAWSDVEKTRAKAEQYRAEQTEAIANIVRLTAENARLAQLDCALHNKTQPEK